MAEAPSRVQQMIARRRRAARRRRLVLLLLILGGGLFTAIKRWTDAHEVFTVEVIRLAACPDHLRGQAAAVLQPLLNRTFFEVAGQAGELRERLARLPEVASATLVCRPPNAVEVRLTPRVPTLAVQAGRSWLSVDSGGVIVRAVSNPERGLPQVYGLQPGVTTPGARLAAAQLAAATAFVTSCEQVLGKPPRVVAFEPGGSLRARTASGELVLLGQPTELERKLYTYQVIRNRLTVPVRYVDVATPSVPVWQPLVAPPAPAQPPDSPTTKLKSG